MGIERRYKDPDESVNFGIDWSDYLGSDTITGSSWIVPAGITQASASFTDTQATIKLSGGTLGSIYRVTNRITTSAGETVDHSIDIEIIEK
jgi:hypothetical protein